MGDLSDAFLSCVYVGSSAKERALLGFSNWVSLALWFLYSAPWRRSKKELIDGRWNKKEASSEQTLLLRMLERSFATR